MTTTRSKPRASSGRDNAARMLRPANSWRSASRIVASAVGTALPHRAVNKAEPVARCAEAQRQPEKAGAIALRQRVEPVALGARDDPFEHRDVLAANDVEFLEEGMAGRQIAKQLSDHAR